MSITRRLFLANTAGMGAAVATISAPAVIEAETLPSVDLTDIPTAILDKIKAWQEAHRTATSAAKAYSTSLRVQPISKPECDRCYAAMAAANETVGPAREAMIMALWRVS